MTALEALAGVGLVVGAFGAARRYRPGRDSPLKLALIFVLATAGGGLTVGQIAFEAMKATTKQVTVQQVKPKATP